MAGPNYEILNTRLPEQIANAPISGFSAAQQAGAQQMQNQLGQMQIVKAGKEMAAENALAELYKSGGSPRDPETIKKMYEISPRQAMVMEKTVAEIDKAKVDAIASRLPIQREMAKNMALDPSPQNIVTNLDYQVRMGWMTPQQANAQLQQLSGKSPQELKTYFTNSAIKADDYAKYLEDVRHHGVVEKQGQQQIGISAGNLNVAQQRLAAETNPELQSRLASAKETGKAQGQAAIALPAALSTAKEGIRKVDELLKSPGFSDAVGATWKPGARFVPGTDAADFMARLDEIKGGAFMQAFNTLKGGGAISEKEGEKATAAITRMSTAQSEKEFRIAAEEFKGVLKQGIINAETKAGKAGKSVTTGGGTIDFNDLK